MTFCTTDRLFSFQNCLRNITPKNRLSGLAFLYIHRNISGSTEAVLDEMAMKRRRIVLREW